MRLRIDPTSPSGLSPIQTDTVISMSSTGGSGTGIVETIVAGANVTVDSTDPKNPIVSATGDGGTTDHAALSNLDYATAGHTGFEPSLPITPANPTSKFLNGNRLWTEIAVGSGGSSANLYLSNLDSATAGYKRLSYTPDATEVTKTIIANNNTVQGEKYLFDAAIDVTSINAGTWVKNFTRSVSAVVLKSNFSVRVFTYTTLGSESTLFTITSTEIEDTTLVTFGDQTTQTTFSCNATDRLGIQVSFTTTRPVNTTFSYIVGDGRTAFISTPLALRHSQLRNVNEIADVQHLTAAQVTKLTGIADGAEVNVNADWDAISGDAQILNKPTIPTQYTDEMAQDAVGGMVNTTLTYTDGTPELKVTNPVTPQAAGFTITAGTTAKTLTVSDTANVTGTNTGDQDLTSYRPEIYGSSAMRTFKAALANKATAPVDMVFIGDSKTECIGVVDVYKTWIQRFITKYRQKNQPDGIRGGFGYVPAVYLAGWPSFALTGSATAQTTLTSDVIGLGKRAVVMTSAGTMTMTLGNGLFGTPTSVDIVYTQNSSQGSFSYSVNGNTPITVNANNATEVVGKRINIASGLIWAGKSDNTITLAWVSGSVNIEGAMVYDGDENAGIRVWEAGHSGANATQYLTTNKWWNALTQIQPALVYYSMGRNDLGNGWSIAQIVTAIKSHIALIRSKITIPPTIIFGMDWKDDIGVAAIDTYENFYDAMLQVCKDDGDIAFFDTYRVFGAMRDASENALALTIDYIHLDAKGQEVMADALMSFIENEVETSGYTELGRPTHEFSGADMNTLPFKNIEMAYGNACTHAPGGTADGYFTQVIHPRLTNYRTQTFITYITRILYIRTMSAGTWSAWAENLINAGALGTPASGILANCTGLPIGAVLNPYKARAYRNGNVTGFVSNTHSKVALNAETYDTNNNFDSTTNYRYDVVVSGYYDIKAFAYLYGTNLTYAYVEVYVDGTKRMQGTSNAITAGETSSIADDRIYIAAGSYVELYVFSYTSTGTFAVVGTSMTSYLTIALWCV